MTAIHEPSPQPFNLDAILQEFDVSNTSEPTTIRQDDSAVARVRESLGLGRSLFRRKDTQEPMDEPTQTDEVDNGDVNMAIDDDGREKLGKPRKRIVDSDDDDDSPPSASANKLSSPLQSGLNDIMDDESMHSDENRGSESDNDLPSTDAIVANFRKARLEALSAKVAAKTRVETEDIESAISEKSQSPARSVSRSPPSSGRKQKVRKASKKALDEMHRETQRMVRNMALRPEVKVTKKIDMSTIFAKFGYNPNKTNTEETIPNPQPEATSELIAEIASVPIETPAVSDPPPPARFAGPNLENSDSDDSLPSPSKLVLSLSSQSQISSTQKKSPIQRKIHFTLPPSSPSDSDSDVEIVHPPPLTTYVATPDRKRLKRTAIIRSLANLKSPGQKRSPGRMTQKELDATLSREAAIQAAKKREERRAELKSLGIDTEKIVEKRDLLEVAREEERRVREEEGVEESDEEYFDDEDNDADNDEESEDDSQDEDDSSDDEMDESGEEDTVFEKAQTKRKSRVVQITSDDEDEPIEPKPSIVPESTFGSQPTVQSLSELRPTDDLNLTQFFNPTQMSESTENMTQKLESQSQAESLGTGLTQFFTSTAIDDDMTLSGDEAAHGRMELLRQKAREVNTDIAKESIRVLGAISDSSTPPLELRQSPPVPTSGSGPSPVGRRILKRRSTTTANSEPLPLETSEEFIKARKELIQEQAEESEDDYKVWGSGDESENENMDGVVEGLIDDETKIKKNAEREIARLYAEDELERDEKFVQGLMHDLQNGGLRRRRGRGLEMGDWDSDDDDDDDAEERLRRWKLKREEMRRRMLEDENLGKLAANPKTQAFLDAISSTTLNFDDEPDFLGENEIIDDRRAGTAARNLPNSVPVGESQSQVQSESQSAQSSAEIEVPATSSGNLPQNTRDRMVIDELTQVEDSQPAVHDDVSLSEVSDSDLEDEPVSSFVTDKVYTGFIDRAAQKRASRTVSDSANRFAFKAVTNASPARIKRPAVSVIEADDESARKKIMKEVVGSKHVKRKVWGPTKGRGAVTFRAPGVRGKENSGSEMRKENGDVEKRRRDILTLMDSQKSFC